MTKKELFSKLPKVKKTDKVIILSHTDLDGSGAIIVANLVFNHCSYKHCSNATMSDDIYSAIELINSDGEYNYDFLIATDISVDAETAKLIDKHYGEYDNFIILDHHKTALHLNEYDWAVVETDLVEDSFRAKYYNEFIDYFKNIYKSDVNTSSMSSSGTSLFYDYLDYLDLINPDYDNSDLHSFVHEVATYDTFDWQNFFNEKRESSKSVKLNNLFNAYGREMFEMRYTEHLRDSFTKLKGYYHNSDKFMRENNLVLSIMEEKKKGYLDRIKESGCIKSKLNYKGKEYSMAIILGGDYLPDVFNLMKQICPSDIYAIIYYANKREQVSLRSDTIDVSELAKEYDGGGHTAAAGFPIPKKIQDIYITGGIFRGNCTIVEE